MKKPNKPAIELFMGWEKAPMSGTDGMPDPVGAAIVVVVTPLQYNVSDVFCNRT